MGRKTRKDKPATERLSIALTPEEKDRLEELAKKQGHSFAGTADYWRFQIMQLADALESPEHELKAWGDLSKPGGPKVEST